MSAYFKPYLNNRLVFNIVYVNLNLCLIIMSVVVALIARNTLFVEVIMYLTFIA